MKRKPTNNPAWRTAARYLLQAFFPVLLHFSAVAQQRIQGKIVDDKGSPLSGATVQVKGTTNTTQTDAQGNYTISAPSASSTLVISFVGYESKKVVVKGGSNTTITLV